MSAPTMNQAPNPNAGPDPLLDPELEQWAQEVERELGLRKADQTQLASSEQQLSTEPEVDPATGEIKADEASVAVTGLDTAAKSDARTTRLRPGGQRRNDTRGKGSPRPGPRGSRSGTSPRPTGTSSATTTPDVQPKTNTETTPSSTTSTETQPTAPASTEAPVDPKTPEATEDDAVAKELALLRKAKAEWVETFGEDGYAARFGGNPDVDPDAYMKKVEAQRAGTADSGEDSDPADPDQSATPAPDSRPSWNPNSMVAAGLRPKGPSLRERLAASRQRRADERATQAATPSQAGTAAASSGQSWSPNNMVATGLRPKGQSMKERFVASRQRRADKRAAQAANPSEVNVATTGSGQAWNPNNMVAADIKERTPKDPDAPVLSTPKIDSLDLTRNPNTPRPSAEDAAAAMVKANRSRIDALDITSHRDFSAVQPKPSRWSPDARTTSPSAPGSV